MKPIAFTGPMVREILAGRKTETRRPIHPQPAKSFDTVRVSDYNICGDNHRRFAFTKEPAGERVTGCMWVVKPFCHPGDKMWVRERARVIARSGNEAYIRYEADGYEAAVQWPERLSSTPIGCCIANGVHREGARIILSIDSVRVERVQAITEDGACLEGFGDSFCPRGEFIDTWVSLYGKSAFSQNPWVFVYTFHMEQIR